MCQTARQFWKNFVNTAKKESFGFQVSPADPCMLYKQNELGICIIIMYMDDMLIIGKKEQIQEFTNKIQKEFSVKIQHNLTDYLGCEFHMNKMKTRGFVEFWCLPPLILFFNMSTGWLGGLFCQQLTIRTRKLSYRNLNWPRCSAQVAESLALTDGSFC